MDPKLNRWFLNKRPLPSSKIVPKCSKQVNLHNKVNKNALTPPEGFKAVVSPHLASASHRPKKIFYLTAESSEVISESFLLY